MGLNAKSFSNYDLDSLENRSHAELDEAKSSMGLSNRNEINIHERHETSESGRLAGPSINKSSKIKGNKNAIAVNYNAVCDLDRMDRFK